MKYLAALLFTALFLIASNLSVAEQHQFGRYSFATDPAIPVWVKPAQPKKSKGKPDGQNTEYALLDTQVHADPDDHQYYKSFSTYLHNSQAVSESSEIQITFNPEYQQLVIHKIEVNRKGKRINALRPEVVRLLQQEEDLRDGILDGAVTALAMVPDTRPGDRLDYSYTIKGRNPVYGKKIFGAQRLGWAVDVGYSRVRVLVPANIQLQTKVHDLKAKYKKKKNGRYSEHSWTVKSVNGRVDEGNYPAWFNRYAFVEYSEFENWKHVEGWAQSLYESLDQNSQELTNLVEKLQQENSNAGDYTQKALDFVQQQVRYLGLEFGQNSHLPHTPEEVLKNRYGDCKDKSNLLVQILRANNIEAYPALVSNSYQEGFTNYLPSPMAFDHVIVMAKIDGETIWMDPTRTNQAGKLHKRAYLRFGSGLLVGASKEKPVIKLKPLKNQSDVIQVKEHFAVKNLKKPVLLTVKSIYTGNQAEYQRYVFNSNSLQEVQDRYLNYYAKIYPSIESGGKLSISDSKDDNVFTITESYRITDFFTEEDGYYKSSYYATSIGQYLGKPQTIRRESPADIGYSKTVSHKIIIDYLGEVGMHIDGTPLIKNVDALGYSSRSVLMGKRFEHQATLNVKKSWVDVQDMSDYFELTNEIENDIDFTLSFVYPYKPSRNKPLKKLLKALEK